MFDTTKIGHSFPPFPVAIERTKLRELALAIGDPNPIYQDQQAAQTEGYVDTPLLATTATIFLFWENRHFIEQLAELGLDSSSIDLVTLRICYTNREGQDVLVATTRLVSRE